MAAAESKGGKIVFRIGMFSQFGKTTVKTLRYYDEISLLCPAHTDPETGYRYYSTGQLFQLHEIIGLRQMGFSIPDIQNILDGIQVDQILSKRRTEVELQLNKASDQLSRINHYIQMRKEGQTMKYQAAIKEIPPTIVFSKRHLRRRDADSTCRLHRYFHSFD